MQQIMDLPQLPQDKAAAVEARARAVEEGAMGSKVAPAAMDKAAGAARSSKWA
jgi:hypothetical protein